MARAFRTLCVLVLLASTMSCADSGYRVRLTFAGVEPTSVRFIELLVLPACPSVTSIASGERPAGTIVAALGLAQSDAASLPALGRLESGVYGLYARGFDTTCAAMAAGCTEVTLERGGEGTLLVELAATIVVGACDLEATCVDGQCVDPATDSGVPQTGTCTLEASADGFASTYAAEAASGEAPTMSTFDGDGVSRMYSFVKFDLTGQCEETGTIPANATVTEATLSLTLEDECISCAHDHTLRRVTVPWTQTSFTGTGTGPAVAPTQSATFTAPASGTADATGLAADVQSFLDDPTSNSGWRISQVANTGASAAGPFRWATLEAAAGSRPRLVVKYEIP